MDVNVFSLFMVVFILMKMYFMGGSFISYCSVIIIKLVWSMCVMMICWYMGISYFVIGVFFKFVLGFNKISVVMFDGFFLKFFGMVEIFKDLVIGMF